MAGRKAKPMKLRLLEGDPSKLGRTALEKRIAAEPKPRPITPICPDHLSAGARQAWAQIVPELELCGLITAVDGMALEVLCNAISEYQNANAMLAKHGYFIKNSKGILTVSPIFKIAKESERTIMRMMSEFGMTPSARARISINRPDDDSEDDFASLLTK